MPRLVVRLLGGYRVELEGEPVYGFETDKARALLAYLMVEADRPHRRETLATLLWPERPDAVARNNLRQALFRVRHALTGGSEPAEDRAPFLFVTPTDVQFNTASDYSFDVAELEALARRGPVGSPPVGEQLLPEAFCADFLAGFSIPDSEAFQAWMLNRQEHYHRLTLEILDAQNAVFEAAGDYEMALAAARRQLQLEPWLEEAHRRCMRALALAGRRDEALRQYEACSRALEAELGVEPAASTRALFAAIRDGRLAAPGLERSAPATELGRPARLVARQNELTRLERYLAAALAGETGVAFISGDPGSGKTALLEAFAGLALAKHPGLLVAGARCRPGGYLDPLAPLRKLGEMLFGNPADELAWRLADPERVERLRRATDFLLASLRDHGPDLAGTLVPAAQDRRSGGPATNMTTNTRLSAGYGSDAFIRDPVRGRLLLQGEIFDQLAATLAAIARKRPLLLLLDDLQWVDDATAAFLLHVGRELNSSRLLVLGAYRSTTVRVGRRDSRSGEVARHPLLEVINELRRSRGDILVDLDRADGRAFVEAYVDTEPNRLGALFRDALYAQTGGHALFTVESLRNLQERGELVKDEAGRWVARASLDWGALPARVEAAIAERIDRLPETERRILSAASVQGDDFSGEIVAELTGLPLGNVLGSLSGSLARQHCLIKAEGLSTAEGVVRTEGAARLEGLQHLAGRQRSVYRFTHHLFQKYVYDELDPVERAHMHAAVAASLDRQAGSDPAARERLGTTLAWHYEAAGLRLAAARALDEAGRQAVRLSAFREALDLFDHGLALLAAEPRTAQPGAAERNEVERLLQVDRLVPQRSLSGAGSQELAGALAQAIEAGAGSAQDRTKLATLHAEAELLISRGQLNDVVSMGEQLLDLAAQSGDEGNTAYAHFWIGFALNLGGDPQEAESHLDWILNRQTPGRWPELRAAVGYDITPPALTIAAVNEWFLGYPEQAARHSARAVTQAQELGDRYGLAVASAIGCMTLFLLRDEPALEERSELCCRVCAEHGFSLWQKYVETFLAWLALRRGQDRGGIEAMQRAVAAWQGEGMVSGADSLFVVLAEACLAAAGPQLPGSNSTAEAARLELLGTGLAAIEGALEHELTGKQGYQAELHRLRGELLLARDGLVLSEEALACFERALELGREKGALAWELRAAVSIVRLRERQGEACAGELAEARAGLRDIYARFTEGFDFPDLREAAALLGLAD